MSVSDVGQVRHGVPVATDHGGSKAFQELLVRAHRLRAEARSHGYRPVRWQIGFEDWQEIVTGALAAPVDGSFQVAEDGWRFLGLPVAEVHEVGISLKSAPRGWRARGAIT